MLKTKEQIRKAQPILTKVQSAELEVQEPRTILANEKQPIKVTKGKQSFLSDLSDLLALESVAYERNPMASKATAPLVSTAEQ